jgi:hypothetical protein
MRGQVGKDGSLSKRRLLELLRCGIRKRVSERVEDSEVEVMKHTLTIKGGRKNYYDSGSCSCGQWSQFLNRVTRRGDILGHREFIKREFKKHKEEAK